MPSCKYCGESLDYKDEIEYKCHRSCCEAIGGHVWVDSDESDGHNDDMNDGVSFHVDVRTYCSNCGQELYDW